MSETVVVTGGAGFIGRNVVAALNARGVDDIIVVDRLDTSEKWRNLIGLRFEDYLDKADFLEQIRRGSRKPVDSVIHMGACSTTTEPDSGYLAENNYRYTRTLCRWCVEHDVRFITASSAATYGDGGRGYSDDDAVTPTLEPLNMYGFSKQMFDLWALRRGLYRKIVGLKFFNVYGPYEDHKGEMRSVVHKAFHQVLEQGHVGLFKSHRPDYEDGRQLRDFVWVGDAVNVVLHFFDQRGRSGLFNCGTGQARSWLDLAHAVFRAMGRRPDVRFIDMPAELRGRYQYFTQADVTKLRAAGYGAPFRSLEDGVREYVRGYLLPRTPQAQQEP